MVKMSFEVSQAELTEASHKGHVRVFNLGEQMQNQQNSFLMVRFFSVHILGRLNLPSNYALSIS